MRNPEDTKYVWDEKNFKIIQKSISKEKRYFVEITIKDSETLEPIRSVSTGSNWSESCFTFPVHHNMIREVNGCLSFLFPTSWNKNE
jgi:hypothetical protein